MKNSLSLVVLLALAVLVEESRSYDTTFLSRWRRQAIHCQADDATCQRCSSSCSTLETSEMPECCEVYNACCDEYFKACKKCASFASKDSYFPEYCCASFTDCCELVTTTDTKVEAPAPVRSKPKFDLKIPEVAAPKPTSFPGAKAVSSGVPEVFPQQQNVFPQEPQLPSQTPAFRPRDSIFPPKTQSTLAQEPTTSPQSPPRPRQQRPSLSVQSPVDAAPDAVDHSQRQRTRTQARAQARPQNRGRQGNRRPQQDTIDLASRRGRLTSRGRVVA